MSASTSTRGRRIMSGRAWLKALPWIALTVGIVGAFVVPFVTLVVMAFRTALPGLPGEWTLDGIVTAFTESDLAKPLMDSMIFAVGSSVGGTLLALFFVFVATRTTTRLRRLITPMMVVILATPVLFFALSWAMLGADNVGLVNKVWSALTGSDESVFSVSSWPGLIFVMSIKLSAFSYFLLIGPSMAMNRSLEEAAEVFGASRAGSFFRIYLPLLSPAIAGSLLIGFISSLQAFDTPQIIGTQAGIRVFSTEIYGYVTNFPANYAAAASLALGMVALLAFLVWAQMRLLRGRDYTTVGGKSTRGAAWSFPRIGWLFDVAIVLFALLAFVLPTVQLVLSSFNTVFGRYDSFSWRNYSKLLDSPVTVSAIGNTVLFMVVGGFVTVVIGAVITAALRVRPTRWKRALEVPTWIPWATPGLVGSLALLGTLLAIPALHPIYGTATAMMIALVIASLPIAIRFLENSILQIDRQLIDAARIGGAGPVRTFTSILIPLIAPSFISGWFVTGLAIAGNLEIPLLLGNTKVTTISGLAFKYYVDSAAPMAAAIFCVLLVTVLVLFALSVLGRRLVTRLLDRRTAIRLESPEAVVTGALLPVVPPSPDELPEREPALK
ncbi:ABC transporter permease [Nakamurella leprariae]|uniref:Iron ABC transporter permease n=1 Tax=Nakamurella leprariae TaxID=2803911 RepID=A0A938YBX3_9ACTN|nr:ABC transporter permease subunit [Nakamurella leprariae]MBM9466999.1 iron ABC transporter permease [Nakamurella leprariae]